MKSNVDVIMTVLEKYAYSTCTRNTNNYCIYSEMVDGTEHILSFVLSRDGYGIIGIRNMSYSECTNVRFNRSDGSVYSVSVCVDEPHSNKIVTINRYRTEYIEEDALTLKPVLASDFSMGLKSTGDDLYALSFELVLLGAPEQDVMNVIHKIKLLETAVLKFVQK